MQIWECRYKTVINGKKKTEPPKSFELFKDYLLLPPLLRSHRFIADKHNVNISAIQQYSSQYNWTKRVRAYDDYLFHLEITDNIKAKKEMALRQQNSVKDFLDVLDVPKKLFLKKVVNKGEINEEVFLSEKYQNLYNMIVKSVNVYSSLVQIDRLVKGESTENKNININDGSNTVFGSHLLNNKELVKDVDGIIRKVTSDDENGVASNNG